MLTGQTPSDARSCPTPAWTRRYAHPACSAVRTGHNQDLFKFFDCNILKSVEALVFPFMTFQLISGYTIRGGFFGVKRHVYVYEDAHLYTDNHAVLV